MSEVCINQAFPGTKRVKGREIMVEPNDALIRFHQKYCIPDLVIDSPEVFFKLLEEINKI